MKNQQEFARKKAVSLAVAAALPFMMAGESAYAACTGTIATPSATTGVTILCNGTGTSGNLTVTDTTTYNDATTTSTAGNNTLIQFDGHGRTLTNAGSIINNRVITGTSGARGRTAVFLGSPTQNAALLGATAPASGATTLNTPGATAAWVGQTVVVGRYNPVEGDMFNGNVRTITAVTGSGATATVTLDKPLDAGFDPGVSLGSELRFKVISNYGAGSKVGGDFYNNVLKNSGTISSQITAAEINGNRSGTASVSYTAAVKAVTASVEGDYIINNAKTGVISVRHDGTGNALGIEEGGTVNGMTINNDGLISAQRTAHLTLSSVTATGNPTATSSDFAALTTAQTVGSVNAINTQEEAEEIIINNSKTGVIRATGDYSGAIYMRAAAKTIVNDGLIEHLSTDGNLNKGFAIAAVSDPGSVRTLDLTNNGVIRGDILAVNGNGLRWYLLSTEGTLDNRLNINSQYGQSDSVINNKGSITGNFYYSNGTHELINHESGTITGNIDVDQRNTVDLVGATVTNGALAGTKQFTFENSGSYSGDITIRTAPSSQISLVPTINGSGAGSSLTAPSSNVAGLGGTLKIFDGASTSTANLATIKPVTAFTVHAGEYFKVADSLFGSTLPAVQSDSALVNWVIDKNAAGNLVVGVDSVNSATSLGLSGSSATVIDTLLSSNTAAGGIVQGLSTAAEIRTAAEQLRPEVNNAAFEAAIGITDRVFGLVDAHLSETHLAQLTGKSGIATGEQAGGTGVWLQAFGGRGDQDRRKSVDGYTADAYGLAFGADTLVGGNNTRLGVSFSYGQSNIEDKGVNAGNKSDIDSYQATLYASALLDGWYLNGTLGLGKHNYDSKRLVLGNVVSGSHDAWQYTARVDAGFPIKLGSATLTPVASLTYSRLNQDGYNESGIGALAIASNDTDSFRSGLGAKALIPLSEGEVKTALELRAIWNHEFGDTRQDTVASFVGGGSSFTTSGVSVARDGLNLGGSIVLAHTASEIQQNLLLSYDAEVKDQYLNQTARLQARFDF